LAQAILVHGSSCGQQFPSAIELVMVMVVRSQAFSIATAEPGIVIHCL